MGRRVVERFVLRRRANCRGGANPVSVPDTHVAGEVAERSEGCLNGARWAATTSGRGVGFDTELSAGVTARRAVPAAPRQ